MHLCSSSIELATGVKINKLAFVDFPYVGENKLGSKETVLREGEKTISVKTRSYSKDTSSNRLDSMAGVGRYRDMPAIVLPSVASSKVTF